MHMRKSIHSEHVYIIYRNVFIHLQNKYIYIVNICIYIYKYIGTKNIYIYTNMYIYIQKCWNATETLPHFLANIRSPKRIHAPTSVLALPDQDKTSHSWRTDGWTSFGTGGCAKQLESRPRSRQHRFGPGPRRDCAVGEPGSFGHRWCPMPHSVYMCRRRYWYK